MRTAPPDLLPLFRSQMQVELLASLLLQPERRWTLQELADALGAPQSSVHRELGRAQATGIIRRDATARPHRFSAATDEPLHEPFAAILRASVGVEGQLRRALDLPGIRAAVIYGSWASGLRQPGSDIDVLVIGDADLRELRGVVRPIGKSAGRAIDLTLLGAGEFERLVGEQASFARRVLEEPAIALIGDVASVARS